MTGYHKAMSIQLATLTEAQAHVLEDLRNGFAPRLTPSTPEELMRAAADEDAGRSEGMSLEEVKAIADALRG